ncbi:MAG: hypothetical protein IH866_03690 [Chloroflexi bacterium]|nr:hypothetical protein [Chloroflexota bacterium]
MDGLGSTTAPTAGTGAVTDINEYDVLRNIRAETGTSSNRFTDTGVQTAGIGLQ